MKQKCTVEITELREVDDDQLGSTLGYFAEGIHDKQQFATVCNQEFDLVALDKNIVHVSQVEQGYLRKEPEPEYPDGEFWSIQLAKQSDDGAFPATFVFF